MDHYQFLQRLFPENDPLLMSDIQSLFLWTIIIFILLSYVFLFPKKNPLKLTKEEKFSLYWHSVNGAIIHIMMDGMVGVFHCFRPLDILYKELDNRFETGDIVPILVGMIEIVFMGPCALYLARLYLYERSLLREIICIILSTVQIMGTLFFYAPEYINGFQNYCKQGPCLDLTAYNLFYFWFGFWFMNILWIVVPFREVKKAWKNINNLQHQKIEDKNQKVKKQ